MRTYRILKIMFVFLLLTGCSDYLEEENKENIVAEEFYTTAEGYEILVNSSYASLRAIFGGDPWVFSAGTDLFVEGRNAQPEGISEYRNLGPDSEVVEDFFRTTYEAIQLANTALYYNEMTEDTPTLDVRKGEVKFLRAFYYFLLVQQFGGVAIVEDRMSEPVIEFERNSAEEVYNFIIAEMEEALQLVPEAPEAPGRVYKRAIRHFLAKVYLTRGYEDFGSAADFDKAASLADATIDGQGLTLPFAEVFRPGNEENEEIIFSVQYNAATLLDPKEDGNSQSYHFGPYFGGEGAIYGYPYRSYMLMPTMYLFNAYTENDQRFEDTFMLTVYGTPHPDGNMRVGYYEYYTAADLSTVPVNKYFAPKWALDDTTAWRAENPDFRGEAVIVPFSEEWQASRQTALDNSTPAIKKFDDPTAAFSGSSSTRDIFLARLAETYLIAAEAYLMAGDPGTAADRINEVRRRAAKPGAESAMLITAADVSIDFILDERARELAGEYHRWTTLKRTGKLQERTKLYNRDIKVWYDAGADPFLGTDGEYKVLRPIPQIALDLNEAEYAQNPGY